MKGIVYRSAALALACIVALSVLAVPSFATDYQSTYNFWNWAYDNSWFLGKAIIGFSAGNVCQVSEDGLHHATTHSGGGGSVDGQQVYNCVCDLCGQEFQAVATDLEQTYYDDTNALYQTIDSNNCIRGFGKWYLRNYVTQGCCTPTFPSGLSSNSSGVNNSCEVASRVAHSSTKKCYLGFVYSVNLDYDCTLYFGSTAISYHGVDASLADGVSLSTYLRNPDDSFAPTQYGQNGYIYHDYKANTQLYVQVDLCGISSPLAGDIEYIFGDLPDVYVILPDQEYVYTPYDYDNVIYVVDDDDIYEKKPLDHIVDEQGLNYYNPVTNTTTNITNWTYDYSDRSYTCTTENNTTTTITYGDEYITINEGDVNNTYITYNIYYYTAPEDSGDGSGSGSDGEGSGSSGSGDNSDDGDGIGGGLGELLGSLLGGLIDLITGLISGLIDSLINLVEMTIEKLGQVVNLFGEFGDALKVLWSWLPDEVVTILAAGVSVVVFASVIKLFV